MMIKKPLMVEAEGNNLENLIKTTSDLGFGAVNYNSMIHNFYDQGRLIADREAKNRKLTNGINKMVCGSYYLPKQNEERPLGDDAHFICAEEQTIGVADGVGGWAKRGVDAGEYARELMINSVMSVQNYTIDKNTTSKAVDPRKVLNEAYENTKKNIGLQGSSTACILTLDKESGVLHSANVGDSGFMVFRNNKMVYKSPTQQHRFNHPYQLGNHINCDTPNSAMEIKVDVIPGDIIMLGTDGLLDNMFPSEIEEKLEEKQIAKILFDQDQDIHDDDCARLAQGIAGYIGELALYNSFDRWAPSPFSTEAAKAGLECMGGKIDDITVIVAIVMPSKFTIF